MSISLTVFILALSIALLVSAVCSLSEAVLLSLTPTQVAQLTQKNTRIGDTWRRFKENIDRPISAILILNTTAHTVGATIAGAEFNVIFGERWIWCFSLVFTFVMLQYTEILPKTLGVRFNQRLARWLIGPLSIAIVALTPVIAFVRWVNLPFEPKHSQGPRERTLDDLILMTALARQTQKIGRQQERIIIEATKLSEKTASQVMILMEDVMRLPVTMTVKEIFNPERHDSHTRYPVYECENQNDIIGYVNLKEIVAAAIDDPEFHDLSEIVREVHFVKPEEPISRLLLAFTSRREHLAVIRDDSGTCLGIITLEDIMEELLGELEDEFDHLPKLIRRDHEEEDLWIVGGGVTMGELYSTLLHPMNETLDPNQTVSAWLESRLPSPIRKDQKILEENILFTIRRVCRKQITEIAVELLSDDDGGIDNAEARNTSRR